MRLVPRSSVICWGYCPVRAVWQDRQAQGTGVGGDGCGLAGEEDKFGCEQAGQAALGRWVETFCGRFPVTGGGSDSVGGLS